MPRRGDTPSGPPPTLGSLLRYNYDLAPWCNGCGRHGETLKIEDLVARFGRDMLALDVDKHLVCKECGSKNVTARVSVRNAPFTPGYKPPG